jgi:protein-tyrosine phosphatase
MSRSRTTSARIVHATRNSLVAALVVCVLSCTPEPAPTPTLESAVVEQTGPDTYSIAVDGTPAAYPVQVFAVPQPGRSGGEELLVDAEQSPIEVRLPAGSGQPFFRLVSNAGDSLTVSIRRLPLEGAPNFRDLGGYRTADGRRLRWGTIYRSGQLSELTEADYEYLSKLGIRLVCDFRVDRERERSPTNWGGAQPPEIIESSIDTVSYAGQAKDIQQHMRNVYNRMPFDGSEQYAALFRRMIDGDLPLLMHCTSGKDRTGFFSALLLTILGVPHETVVEDFLLTNHYLVPDDRIPQMAKQMQERRHLEVLPDTETVRAATGVLESNLEIGFAVIREKYGTIEDYARDALKLSADDVESLRGRLLE